MKKIQKWLSLLLCLAMLFSVVPMGALAAETDNTDETATEDTTPSEEVTEASEEGEVTPDEEPVNEPEADASTQEVADTDVAKIGDTGYATLADAVAAAVAGDTIYLLQDMTISTAVAVKTSVTITAESAVTITRGGTNDIFDVNANATLTLEGPITLVGSTKYGTMVDVLKNGTFIMNDGVTIKDNQTGKANYAGGVTVTDGTFIMNGGTIDNCSNTGSSKPGSTGGGTVGGGVRVIASKNATVAASFTMNGGTISNCSCYLGGAIGIENKGTATATTVTMNGGTITGCSSSGNSAGYRGGSAVYIYNKIASGATVEAATFTMNGGKIVGNTAKYNGALCAYTGTSGNSYGGKFYILGGEISGNKSGNGTPGSGYGNGIYIDRLINNLPLLTIGGNAIISDDIHIKTATGNHFEILDGFTGYVEVYSQAGGTGSSPVYGTLVAKQVSSTGVASTATKDIAGRIVAVYGQSLDSDGNVYEHPVYDIVLGTNSDEYVLGEFITEYTITYTDGVDGIEIFPDQTYTVLGGEATPAFIGEIVRPGYKFLGWNPAVSDTANADVTYTATWEAVPSGEFNGVTFRGDNEGLSVELENVMALESVQIKVYSNNELLTTVSWRDEYIEKGVYQDFLTASVRTGEEESTQWAATEWTPYINKMPTKLELYIDGQLTDTLALELDIEQWKAQAGVTLPVGGDIIRAWLNEENGRIMVDMEAVAFFNSVALELYSGETLLATANLNTAEWGSDVYAELTGSICVRNYADSDTWVCTQWTALDGVVPTEVRLVVDGNVVDVCTDILNTGLTGNMTGDDWAAFPGTNVVRIESNGAYYESLQAALDAAKVLLEGDSDAEKITLLGNTTECVKLSWGRGNGNMSLTIDLNGYTVTGDGSSSVMVFQGLTSGSGKFHIVIDDSSEAKTGTVTGGNATSGGAIKLDGAKSGDSLTVNGGNFVKNTATSTGGALYCAVVGARIYINGGVFEENTAKSGGAISAYSLEINGGVFKNNSAIGDAQFTGRGGAISMWGAVALDLKITGGTFEGNTATRYGDDIVFCSTNKTTASMSLMTPTGGAMWYVDGYNGAYGSEANLTDRHNPEAPVAFADYADFSGSEAKGIAVALKLDTIKPTAPDKYGSNVTPALVRVICDSDENHAPIDIKWQHQSTKIRHGAEVTWNEELNAWTIDIRIDGLSTYYVYFNFSEVYNDINHDMVDVDQKVIDTYLVWDAAKNLWVTPDGNPFNIHVTCVTKPALPISIHMRSFQIQVKGDLDGDGIWGENGLTNDSGIYELFTTSIPYENMTFSEIYGSRTEGFFVDVTVTLEDDDIYLRNWIAQRAPGEAYGYNWELTQKTVTFTMKYAADLAGDLYGERAYDWVNAATGEIFGIVGEAFVGKVYTVTYTDGVEDEEVFADQVYTAVDGTATPAFDGEPTRADWIFLGWTPEVSDTVTGDVTYTATWAPTVNKYGYNVATDLLTVICDTDEDHAPVSGKWYPQSCEVFPKNSQPVWDEELGTWVIGVRVQSLTIHYIRTLEKTYNNIHHDLVGESVIVTNLKWDAEQNLWVPTEALEVHCSCRTVPTLPEESALRSYQIQVKGELDGDGIWGEPGNPTVNDSGILELYTTSIPYENMAIGEVYGSREEGFFVDITVSLEDDDIYLRNWIANCAPGESYGYLWSKTEKTFTFTLKYNGDLTGTLYGHRHASNTNYDWVLASNGSHFGTVAEAFVGKNVTVTYTDGIDDQEIFADVVLPALTTEPTPAFDGEPTREGYVFLGWTPEVAETVTGDAVYTATWAPVIVTQPVDCVAYINTKAYFNVVATGDDLTYQWQFSRDGETWTDSDLWVAVTDTLSMKATAYRDGLLYRCVITDRYGASVISDTASLDTLQIRITKQPYTLYVTRDHQAKFTVKAEGEGLTYQWQYSRDGETWTNSPLNSAVTDTLVMKATANRNGMLYRCVITNADGETITTRVVGLFSTPAITVTKQPVDCSVELDGTMTFSVTVAESGVNYQWQFSEDGGETWQDSPLWAANTNSISMKATEYRNTLVYRCVITDADGNMVITDHVVLILK